MDTYNLCEMDGKKVKPKISILIYSLAAGGAERQVSILLKALKNKYSITLVLMNNTIFYDIPKDTDIVFLEKSNPLESGFKKLLKLPLLGWKYKRILQENKIDLSLSFMTRPNYINIFAKLFTSNVRTVISERSQFSMQYSYNNIQSFINKKLVKLYNYADLIVANSQGNAKDLSSKFNIHTEIRTIYNTIDIKKINTLKNKNIELGTKKFVFVTVGRLDEGKNHLMMIDAMKEVEAVLWIIGDGVLRESIKQYIIKENLQEKVILFGQQENPYKYLSKADCFVFTSNHEGFPNVLLESLACELPIISTDCQSGPREILAPKSNVDFQLEKNYEIAEFGILTPVKDTKKLEETMRLIVNDENLRNTYQEKAKKRVDNFKIEKIIELYEGILCVE